MAAGVVAAIERLGIELGAELADIDERRALPAAVVARLVEADVFRLAVAADYGGAEATPAEQVRAVEAAARVDGSLGWCVMIGVSGGYVSGLLDPAIARELYSRPDAVMAGQIVPAARADVEAGGYRVSGRCRFASGITHATIVNVGCAVFDGGQPVGVRSMLLRKDQIDVVESWDTLGMRGTGSHDFVVDDVLVPRERSFSAFDRPVIDRPLYRFAPLFLAPHAGVPLGIAQGALDELHRLARAKQTAPSQHAGAPPTLLRDDPAVQAALARVEVTLAAARALVYDTLEHLWATLQTGATPDARGRAMYRAMLVYVHRSCRALVDELFDLAATSAIGRGGPLERRLRDLTTACQHRVVHDKMYRFAGQLLVDLPPGDPFF